MMWMVKFISEKQITLSKNVLRNIVAIFALSRNSIQDQISRKLKEDEKKSKDAEREKQQLRDEDRYDGNYKKRHS